MQLEEKALGVLCERAGSWVDAVDVAKAVNRNVYDGVVHALNRLVEQGLAHRHEDFTWRYCVTERGLRGDPAAANN